MDQVNRCKDQCGPVVKKTPVLFPELSFCQPIEKKNDLGNTHQENRRRQSDSKQRKAPEIYPPVYYPSFRRKVHYPKTHQSMPASIFL